MQPDVHPPRLRRAIANLPDVERIDRDDFIANYFDYRPGQHLTIAGPTQRGKTWLGLQLLDATASPDLQAVILVSKPRDRTMEKFRKRTNGRFRTVQTWDPPSEWPWNRNKRSGYILHPRQGLQDFDEDNAHIREEFRQGIMDSYRSKNARILFIDEAHEVQNELRLKKEVEGVLMRGSSVECGEWCLIQRTAHNSYAVYNAPEHLFLFNDPDRRNRQRFAEIGGGVDPDLVEYVTNNLGQYEVLYIKRTGDNGPLLCIVNP